MRLTLFRDPACAPSATYRLGIAWRETLWTSLMHYRLVLVAWPAAVALLVLREQSKMFMRTGEYLNHFVTLSLICRRNDANFLRFVISLYTATTTLLVCRNIHHSSSARIRPSSFS